MATEQNKKFRDATRQRVRDAAKALIKEGTYITGESMIINRLRYYIHIEIKKK